MEIKTRIQCTVPNIFQHMQWPVAICMMIISSDIKCHGALKFCSWCLVKFSGVWWSLYQHPSRIPLQCLIWFYTHTHFAVSHEVTDVCRRIVFIYFEKKFQPSLHKNFQHVFLKKTLKWRIFLVPDNCNIFFKLSVNKLLLKWVTVLWERCEKWRGICKLNWCISKCK